MLRAHRAILLFFVTLYMGAVTANPVQLEYSRAQLLSEYSTINGKQSFWVALKLDYKKDWHSYWQNPGSSGMATAIDWELPQGWSASSIIWQPPEAIPFSSGMVYGYHNNAYHLVRITPNNDLREPLMLHAKASWLVCKEECIPQEANIALPLAVGESNISSDFQPKIQELLAVLALPVVNNRLIDQEERYRLILAGLSDEAIQTAYVFSEDPHIIALDAKQTLSKIDGTFALDLPKGIEKKAQSVPGFLQWHDNNGVHYARLPSEPVGTATAQPLLEVSNSQMPLSFSMILLFAFLGGIILNAMPCVFPVLSMKAVSLVQKSTQGVRYTIMHGLAYTMGVLATFAAIAGIMLILKASGQAVGWGFQMQNPVFVGVLVYLLYLVGLNLLGVFTVFLPIGFSVGKNQDTLLASLATGVIATLVATPCTAPFMATSLGVAITYPWFDAMMVFLVLGLGLAFPYLLLTVVPGALRFLPAPGTWMNTVKQFLSFPMFFSVVWLLWVLMQQVDINSLAMVLIGLVALSFLIWFIGAIKNRLSWPSISFILILLLASAYPLFHLSEYAYAPLQDTPSVSPILSYDENVLDEKVVNGEKVFVYATAAWCITCKVNEKVALNTPAVQNFFRSNTIVQMRADWTNQDPKITEFLNAFGRDGVPLYVLFDGKDKEPLILPQLLTPNIVIDAMSKKLEGTP